MDRIKKKSGKQDPGRGGREKTRGSHRHTSTQRGTMGYEKQEQNEAKTCARGKREHGEFQGGVF